MPMGVCVGGFEHGTLFMKSAPWHNCFTLHGRFVESDGMGGSIELPLTKITYTWAHVCAGDRTYHVWVADNGDNEQIRLHDAVLTLLDATASERAAVECLPVHNCQLTSGGGVVR